jgi:cyclopropane fatty-acyl-phospholipid synthase-like methyltransferase
LEVGCGQGANLWFLAKEGFDVYGVDISPSAIKKTDENLKENWNIENVTLDVQNIVNLNFGKTKFDVIIDIGTIVCLPYKDHSNIYDKIYHLLKDGGKFWGFQLAEGTWGQSSGKTVDYKTVENIKEGPLVGKGTVCMISDDDVLTLLKNAGFKNIDIEKYTRTYENQTKKVVDWIIECTK